MLRRTPGSPYSNAEVGAARTELIWHNCSSRVREWLLPLLLLLPLLRLLLLHCGRGTTDLIVGQTDGLTATEESVPSGQYQSVGREVNTVPRRW